MSKSREKFANDVMDVIENLIAKNQNFRWKHVLDGVLTAGICIPDWMYVRSILKVYVEDKIIARTNDAQIEEYQVLKWNYFKVKNV